MSDFYEENKEFMDKQEHNIATRKKAKAGIMTYLPSAILTLILIALSSLGTLIQFNFKIEEIIWSTFFISLSLRLISVFLAKYVGSNLYYNKALYSEEYQSFKKDFIKASEDIDKSDFELYIKNYNLAEKKKAYIQNKRNKIAKIEIKINKLITKNDIYYKKANDFKISELKKKKAEIERISNDEFVDKNIKYIKGIKYYPVKSCFFFSPEEDSSENKQNYNVNFSKENTNEIIKTLPLTCLLVVLGSLIGYNAIVGNVNAVSVLYDVGNMLFNFIIGWFVIGKKIVSKAFNVFINRLIFIDGYKKRK